MTTRDRIATQVLAVVEQFARELRPTGAAAPVRPDSLLEADLGLDSLSVAELLVRIEAALGHRVPESTLTDARAVGDLAAAADAHVRTTRFDPSDPTQGSAGPHRGPGGGPSRGPSSGPTRDADRVGGAYRLAVFGTVAAVVWPLLGVVPGLVRRWRLVTGAGRWLFAATGTGLRVLGRERLPAGPYVVVANHPSFLDPLVVAMSLPEPLTFTALEDLTSDPVARRVLRCLEVEPVPRSADRRRALAAAGVLRRLAAQGRRLVFFPEGRRSTSGGLERFRMGAFVVAAAEGLPVVPVTIRGTRAILPVGARWPRHGNVEVEIGWPVRATSTGFDAAIAVHHRVREQILAACDEPDHGGTFRS